MNNKNTENVQEQYENALVALIMDEYTEAEGAMLLKEFKEADEKGEVPDVPADLDAACRKKIHSHFAKQRSEKTLRCVVKTVAKSAAMLLVVLGFASVLIFSVEAFRVPVINFFLEQHEHFSVIGHGGSDEPQRETNEHQGNNDVPLAGLVPNEYLLKKYVPKENGTYYVSYENGTGERVVCQCNPGYGLSSYDTEDIEIEPVKVKDCEGVLIRKDGIKMIWYVSEEDRTYQIKATNLELDIIWQMAETIIEQGDDNE